MNEPRIEWSMAHQPNARDEMIALGAQPLSEKEDDFVVIYLNKTQEVFLFFYDGAYGRLVSERK